MTWKSAVSWERKGHRRRPSASGVAILQLITLICILCGSRPSVFGATLYVAPNGNDDWSGTIPQPNRDHTDGPVSTLERARDIVRTWKRTGQLAADPAAVEIQIADGLYEISEPLILTSADSGTASSPVRYLAAPGATPVISGGRRITEWTKTKDGNWESQLSAESQFEQLWVNGHRATRSREPNDSFRTMGKTDERRFRGSSEQFVRSTELAVESMRLLRSLTADQLKDVTLVAVHKWCMSRRYLQRLTSDGTGIVTIGEAQRHYSPWNIGTRYFLENLPRAVNVSGEWHLSEHSKLVYRPRAGESIQSANVVAPIATRLLVIEGSPLRGKRVEHIEVRGLTFEHNHVALPRTGHVPYQAAFATSAAITVDGASHILFDDCVVRHTGDSAIWFRQGVRDCRIQHCRLHDLGAGGVRIGEGDSDPLLPHQTHRIVVDNNIIHNGGRVYSTGVGVWIGHSGNNIISHNEIADFRYMGVSVGWQWGYAPSLATQNRIRFNHIHHIGQAYHSDIGGIYTLGPSPGTVIRNNVIHDIEAYDYGGWGLYTDEGSSDVLIDNNLVYKTKSGAFHQHFGRDNLIRNNIFAMNRDQQIQLTRAEHHRSLQLERNIIYSRSGRLFDGPWDRVIASIDNNCYFRDGEVPPDFSGMTWQQWQAQGFDRRSVIADPGFADVDNDNFRLGQDSAARKIGFVPFPIDKAGVYGSDSWRKLAANLPMPEVIATAAPKMNIVEDFESTAVGQRPHGVTYQDEGHLKSLAVTNRLAKSGRHCLRIADSAAFQHKYNPHFFVTPNYENGRILCAFDLMISEDAALNFQWRDWRNATMEVGPSLSIQDQELKVDGQPPIKFPAGRWHHILMTARLGKRQPPANGDSVNDSQPPALGRWQVVVTLADREKFHLKGLPFVSKRFQHLTWLGMTSEASTNAEIFLDNLIVQSDR